MERLSGILLTLGENIIMGLTRLLGAIVLLSIGWLIAKFSARFIVRLLQSLGIDKLGEKIKTVDLFHSLDFKVSDIIGKLVYWVLLLTFVITAADIVGLSSVSDGVTGLLAYLPKVVSASLFFIIGAIIANAIKTVLNAAFLSMGVPTGKVIGTFIFYFLIIIIAVTSLSQAGLDTQIITQNISIASAAIFFAFALAYGFASRDILANILASFYSKDKFSVGQRIKIDGIEGTIERIDSTSFTIATADSEVIMPLQRLLNSTVEVFK